MPTNSGDKDRQDKDHAGGDDDDDTTELLHELRKIKHEWAAGKARVVQAEAMITEAKHK